MRGPRFVVAARPGLVDRPVGARLVNVDSHRPVRLVATATDPMGVAFSSWAEYESDADGMVDPAGQAPKDGTYGGVDHYGLWWSMTSPSGSDFGEGLDPVPTTLAAEVGGRPVARATWARPRIRHDVEVRPLPEAGLVGTWFAPGPGNGHSRAPRGGVVVLGGSGGGLRWSQRCAALLASRGFAAVALGYFGSQGGSGVLRGVALEYVAHAVEWLAGASDTRVGLVGRSRGGELALLAATVSPVVGAVVAYAAGGLAWAGLDQDSADPDPGPAWTKGGAALPYLMPDPLLVSRATTREPALLVHAYRAALADAEAVAAATIPVETIRAPLLLVSGAEDHLWPSSEMARLTMERLARHRHPYPDRHLVYPGAGHGVGAVAGLPAPATVVVHPADGIAYDLGGSRGADAASGADSWPRVLRFLRRHLGGPDAAARSKWHRGPGCGG